MNDPKTVREQPKVTVTQYKTLTNTVRILRLSGVHLEPEQLLRLENIERTLSAIRDGQIRIVEDHE